MSCIRLVPLCTLIEMPELNIKKIFPLLYLVNYSIMNSEKLSKVIDTMRMPLIFLVIIAHLAPFTQPVIKFNISPNDTYVLVSEMFSHHIAKFSVRCYFLVSGFYFFKNYSGELIPFYKKQLKSRFRTIVSPYFIWIIITSIVIFSKNMVFVKLGKPIDEDFGVLMNSGWYHNIWEVPINFPLWYLRDLICMVLISPLIVFYIKYFKGFGIITLAILYLALIEIPIPGLSMTAIFFFSLGAYFSLEKRDMLQLFSKIKITAYVVTLLFLILSLKTNGTDYHEYFLRVFILTGVISTFNLFSFLNGNFKGMNRLTGFSSLSFFIYVAHEIYIIAWLKGFFFNHHLFVDGWERFIAYFIIPILCVAVCVVIYFIMMKVMPKVFVFLLGGRVPNYHRIESTKSPKIFKAG